MPVFDDTLKTGLAGELGAVAISKCRSPDQKVRETLRLMGSPERHASPVSLAAKFASAPEQGHADRINLAAGQPLRDWT